MKFPSDDLYLIDGGDYAEQSSMRAEERDALVVENADLNRQLTALEKEVGALKVDLEYERGRNAMMAKTMEHYPGTAEADRLELRVELRAEREKARILELAVQSLMAERV